MSRPQSSVFLCHNSHDKPFVRRLARHLIRAGFDVWLDEFELSVGDSLIDRLATAITTSTFLLAVISRHSLESNWVKKELSLAMTREIVGQNVVVMPVLIDDCELPEHLRDKLYADFRTTQGSLVQFIRLVKSMGGLSDFETPLTIAQLGVFDLWSDLDLIAVELPHVGHHSLSSFFSPIVEGNHRIGAHPVRYQQFRRRPFPRPRVFILWHEEGLTRQDALSLVAALDDIDAEGVIAKHWNPLRPDAVFIARDAERSLVRSVLKALPYEPLYIYPTNYLDPECGALSGCAMSVGLDSRTRASSSFSSQKPRTLSDEVRTILTHSDISVEQFRKVLDEYLG